MPINHGRHLARQSAIMLEITFARFYKRLSEWQPPGRGTRTICQRCFNSPMLEAPVFRAMPHDVIHPLIWELHWIVNNRFEQLLDEHEAWISSFPFEHYETTVERIGRLSKMSKRAESELWAELARRMPELDEARLRYIEPRLEGYIEREFADGYSDSEDE
ncbi:MAG: hypothetical protein ACOH1U_07840 [Rhodoglobus sp.]